MEDFLARIKGRLVKRSGHLTPQERQQRFRQRYAAIGSAHAAAVAAAADADAAAADAAALRPVQQTEIPECLQYLVDQLVRENVSAGERLDDGACTELFLSENMLDALEAQSAADVPLGYRSQLIQSATTLVTMLDEMMVAQRAFHLPLQRLLKTATAQPKFPYQDALLELEYAIAAKIHGAPRLIPLFFEKPLSPDASAPSTSSPALTTAPAGSSEPTWAFPLLDHLLQYLHLEGRRGDVARTAVLALLECTDDDLAAYIDRTEFHNIVVAGLGGLFSQLPSRLPRHAMSQADGPGAAGAVPAGAAAAPPTRIVALGVTTFRADLNALVCLLNWVQSVFTRCSHPRLLQRLASHIEQIFFAQILSTALMDASDFDGTAATALAYTTLMAQTITVPPLAEAFCQVLLGAEDSDARRAGGDDMDADPPPGTPASVLSARSRVDLELTVRDILLSKTSSLVEDVAVASLQLLQILVFQHGPFAVNALFEHLPFTTLEGWPMARERVSASRVVALPATTAAAGGDHGDGDDGPPFPFALSIHQHNHLLMRYYELAEQSRAIMGDAATDADASRRSSVASLRSPSQHDTLRHVPAPLRRFSDLETTPHAAHGTVEAYVHDAWAVYLHQQQLPTFQHYLRTRCRPLVASMTLRTGGDGTPAAAATTATRAGSSAAAVKRIGFPTPSDDADADADNGGGGGDSSRHDAAAGAAPAPRDPAIRTVVSLGMLRPAAAAGAAHGTGGGVARRAMTTMMPTRARLSAMGLEEKMANLALDTDPQTLASAAAAAERRLRDPAARPPPALPLPLPRDAVADGVAASVSAAAADGPAGARDPGAPPAVSAMAQAHLRRMARDPTLRKLMASLANFFSNAFAYNLVLTGMLSTLVKQPDPTLHFYLLHADLLMPAAGSVTVSAHSQANGPADVQAEAQSRTDIDTDADANADADADADAEAEAEPDPAMTATAEGDAEGNVAADVERHAASGTPPARTALTPAPSARPDAGPGGPRPGPLAGAPSLYTLLRQRWSEVESRRQADPRRFAEQVRAASVFLFEGEYDRAQALGAGGSSWFVTTAPASASPAGGAGPDPEHEYFLNVIILQEFIKEVLGVQLASLMSPYVHVAYV